MKKNIILITSIALLCVLIWYLFIHSKDATPIVRSSGDVVVIESEQKYCDSLGPQDGSASLNTHFVTNLKENMLLSNNFEMLGCIKNISDSYGNWETQDGYIAKYEIKTTSGVLAGRGVLPVDKNIVALENLSEINSHIPFTKIVTLGNTNNEKTGYISLRNINTSGDPQNDKIIRLQVQFE